MKRLLNRAEEQTAHQLRAATEPLGAEVHAKVRLADVLEIEGSGIDRSDFRFALQSHFDFLITDLEYAPLFAVEFDGPLHRTSTTQAHRDRRKDRLCRRFGLPLLRVNQRYLDQSPCRDPLLAWFVRSWFHLARFQDGQDAGCIPWDEPYVPPCVARPSIDGFWELRQRRQIPPGSCWSAARDTTTGVTRGIACNLVSDTHGVLVRSGIRAQQFPVAECEVLSELLISEAYEATLRALNGVEAATPRDAIDAEFLRFDAGEAETAFGSWG